MKHAAIGVSLCAMLAAALPLFSQSPALIEKSQQARELMAAGKYEEAVPVYQELVRALPGNPRMVLNLGLALHMSGHETEAIVEFEKVLKADPTSLPAHLYLGYAYLDLGQPAQARRPLEEAVRAAPNDTDSRENLASALLALNHYAAAAKQFRNLSERGVQSAKVWYGLGRCYEALSQQWFEKLAKIAPGSAYWLALAADARLKDQQLSSAFYLYRRALEKQSGLRGAHAALAEIYQKTGHADWAGTETEREQKLGPPDCGRDSMACEFLADRYENIISSPLETPETCFWKTKAYNKLAVQAFSHLAEHQNSAEYHELMARVHGGEGETHQAVDEWRKAYELSRASVDVGTNLALALIQVQDNPGVEKLAEELLRRQPDSAELNYLLGDALANQQELQKAIPYLEKAVRLDPGLLSAHQMLAQALLQTGQSKKAISHLKAALPLDQDGSLHYQLARAYQSAGKTALARAMLESYQKIHKSAAAERQSTMQEVRITRP